MQLAQAGAVLLIMGVIWAIGRLVIFPKAKQRSFYPYATMILGLCAFLAGVALESWG